MVRDYLGHSTFFDSCYVISSKNSPMLYFCSIYLWPVSDRIIGGRGLFFRSLSHRSQNATGSAPLLPLLQSMYGMNGARNLVSIFTQGYNFFPILYPAPCSLDLGSLPDYFCVQSLQFLLYHFPTSYCLHLPLSDMRSHF